MYKYKYDLFARDLGNQMALLLQLREPRRQILLQLRNRLLLLLRAPLQIAHASLQLLFQRFGVRV